MKKAWKSSFNAFLVKDDHKKPILQFTVCKCQFYFPQKPQISSTLAFFQHSPVLLLRKADFNTRTSVRFMRLMKILTVSAATGDT